MGIHPSTLCPSGVESLNDIEYLKVKDFDKFEQRCIILPGKDGPFWDCFRVEIVWKKNWRSEVISTGAAHLPPKCLALPSLLAPSRRPQTKKILRHHALSTFHSLSISTRAGAPPSFLTRTTISHLRPSRALHSMQTPSSLALFLSLALLSLSVATPSNSTSPATLACKSTLYPKLCRAILSHLPSSPSDPLAFGRFSVKQSLKQARRSSRILAHFLESRGNHVDAGALADCRQLSDLNLDYLDGIAAELSRGSTRSMGEEAVERVRALLSAIVTNQQTCFDGLVYSKSGAVLYAPLSNVTELYSVSLGLVNGALGSRKRKGKKAVGGRFLEEANRGVHTPVKVFGKVIFGAVRRVGVWLLRHSVCCICCSGFTYKHVTCRCPLVGHGIHPPRSVGSLEAGLGVRVGSSTCWWLHENMLPVVFDPLFPRSQKKTPQLCMALFPFRLFSVLAVLAHPSSSWGGITALLLRELGGSRLDATLGVILRMVP
ncbi:hypothetical protein ACLOJK_025123 [Asimina triloba]